MRSIESASVACERVLLDCMQVIAESLVFKQWPCSDEILEYVRDKLRMLFSHADSRASRKVIN